jgi:hypothetical protein
MFSFRVALDVIGFDFCNIDLIFQVNSVPSAGASVAFTDCTTQSTWSLDCDVDMA